MRTEREYTHEQRLEAAKLYPDELIRENYVTAIEFILKMEELYEYDNDGTAIVGGVADQCFDFLNWWDIPTEAKRK